MYHEFPLSLGLSGHSLFNVHTESILLCYWMINQESRQRVPLHFHLLLGRQQCSSATYTKVRSRIIELNLFYLTIYAGKWSGMLILNFSAYGLKIVSLHSFGIHMIHPGSPTRRQFRTSSLVHKIYPRPPCRIFPLLLRVPLERKWNWNSGTKWMLIRHVFDKSVKVSIREKIWYLNTESITNCFFAYFF